MLEMDVAQDLKARLTKAMPDYVWQVFVGRLGCRVLIAPQRANLRRAATLPSLSATDSSVIAAAAADATQQFRGLRDGRGRKV